MTGTNSSLNRERAILLIAVFIVCVLFIHTTSWFDSILLLIDCSATSNDDDLTRKSHSKKRAMRGSNAAIYRLRWDVTMAATQFIYACVECTQCTVYTDQEESTRTEKVSERRK